VNEWDPLILLLFLLAVVFIILIISKFKKKIPALDKWSLISSKLHENEDIELLFECKTEKYYENEIVQNIDTTEIVDPRETLCITNVCLRRCTFILEDKEWIIDKGKAVNYKDMRVLRYEENFGRNGDFAEMEIEFHTGANNPLTIEYYSDNVKEAKKFRDMLEHKISFFKVFSQLDLAGLINSNLLTEEQAKDIKKSIFGLSNEERDKYVRTLNNLHSLYKDGALTESEFNDKKWGLLSKIK
jgi:hypothetical protein